MTDRRWKAIERLVADFWGGTRNPTSGEMSKHGTHADILRVRGVYIEVKHGASVPTSFAKRDALWMDTREKAEAEGRVPVLVLHPKRLRDPVEAWPTIVELPVSGGVMVQVPQVVARELVGTFIPYPRIPK